MSWVLWGTTSTSFLVTTVSLLDFSIFPLKNSWCSGAALLVFSGGTTMGSYIIGSGSAQLNASPFTMSKVCSDATLSYTATLISSTVATIVPPALPIFVTYSNTNYITVYTTNNAFVGSYVFEIEAAIV